MCSDRIDRGRGTDKIKVAKIDAVEAEYSAFEIIHETDGLIDTARELNIAYVAYAPLGRGWLVDDFPFNSPDDYPQGDYRCGSPKFSGDNFYKNRSIVLEFQKLAKRKGCTLSQVAIAWVASQGMIPIPVSSISRLAKVHIDRCRAPRRYIGWKRTGRLEM